MTPPRTQPPFGASGGTAAFTEQWSNLMKTPALTALVGCAAAALMLSCAPALAGEVTGNGKPTAAPDHANSICAFSGLNDVPEGAPGNPAGHTQNYGHTMQLFNLIPRLFNPGDACNPNLAE
jgi:hypothetical protein